MCFCMNNRNYSMCGNGLSRCCGGCGAGFNGMDYCGNYGSRCNGYNYCNYPVPYIIKFRYCLTGNGYAVANMPFNGFGDGCNRYC